MNHSFKMTAFSLLLVFTIPGMAVPYSIPIRLDYALIKKVLSSQVYTGAGDSAQLWHDKHNCSNLTLSDLKVSTQNEQIRLINNVHAQMGAHFGGQCLPLLVWEGVLETLQKPTLSPDHSLLSLPVTKAIAYDLNGKPLANEKLQGLIKNVAEPKLNALKIDLNKSRGDIKKVVTKYVAAENQAQASAIIDSLTFDSVGVNQDNISLKLAFDGPSKLEAPKAQPAFTEEEQAQWRAKWDDWNAYLGGAIEKAVEESKSPELGKILRSILQDSKTAFDAGLKQHNPDSDPVRVFFIHAWEQLVPEFRSLAKAMPGLQSLRYLTFIAATDVIYEIESIGSPFGFTVSSDGLRRLVRDSIADK